MIYSRLTKVVSVLALASMLLAPALTHADLVGLSDGDIGVSISPENPGSYQDATITISSYATDLSKAMIQWKNGGTIVLSGYGKTSYGFRTGGADTSVSYTITIVPTEGGSVTKQVVIRPSDLDVVWEAPDAYTPPFYRGKSFPTQGGMIRVVALPSTSVIKSGKGNVSYTWSHNGSVVGDMSGYNKDSFSFKNSDLVNTENIGVEASSIDGRYTADSSMSISIAKPSLLFYQKSPTEGILYNRSLISGMAVSGSQMTIVAAPYFLALKGHEKDFTYSWQINGQGIATPSRKTQLTVQPTASGGYATIGVTFENLSAFFQKVTGTLKLNL